MSIIWLRHKTGGTTTERRFDALIQTDKLNTNRITGRTLREIDFNHRLSRRRIYDVTLGADEMVVDAAYSFVEDFWSADEWWISLATSVTVPDDGTFIACTIPGGDLPVTYLEGNKRLRSVSFTLTARNPL